MAVSDLEAIEGLTAAVAGLVARSPQSSSQPLVAVRPERIVPTGLGGLVGERTTVVGDEDVIDELFGRRVHGTLIVTARDEDAAELPDEVPRVLAALLGADRSTRQAVGILHLLFKQAGSPYVQGGFQSQDMTFDVIYELVSVPDDERNVIADIPINVDTS